MKRILFITILLIHAYNISFAQDSDSLQIMPNDSTIAETINSFEKVVVYYLSGGLGITIDGALRNLHNSFEKGPVFNIGFELPLSYSHDFSVEATVYYWFAKSNLDPEDFHSKYDFISLGNEIYSQFGISSKLKWNIFRLSDNIRLSIHLGYLLFNTSCYQYSPGGLDLEFGCSINYTINKDSYFNLTYNSNSAGYTINSYRYDSVVPSHLVFNYYYKFNW